MIEIPSQILKKLQCVQCGGYLSCGPIVINEKDQQLCGRCFKILPDEIKSHCVREIGLEAVAEILMFPCRYNIQGCTYIFPWNTGQDHEINCPHRYNSLSQDNPPRNNSQSTYHAKELEVTLRCDKVDNKSNIEADKLKFNINITGKTGNKLYLNNENVKLILEAVVSLDVVPKIAYSYAFVEKHADEDVYESHVLHNIKCVNCQKGVLNSEIYHCGFGHTLCRCCKSNICSICGILPDSRLSQHYCKNYAKGCTELFQTGLIYKHETDCEFSDFRCPLCEFTDCVNLLVDHFKLIHDCLILSSEFSINLAKKDKEWFLYCYNKLFHCKYYNYYDSIEFLVNYIGSNDNASNYKFEVNLAIKNFKNLTNSAKCLGWNETCLDKAVSFQLDCDLRKNVQVRLSIYRLCV